VALNYPFYHYVIDNFLDDKKAKIISKEFPNYNSDIWYCYDNPLENKKTCNSWYQFEAETYKTLSYLNSSKFIQKLEKVTGISKLYPDIGLHGGGLHIHGRGGKLNVHLDYSIHPKLKLQRKLNLIIYLTEDWNCEWGGSLEFWSHNEEKNRPYKKVVSVDNVFNRAVLFDTTQNSWHGFPKPLTCPENTYRRSLAVYYLTDPPEDVDTRSRALYAPTKEQEENPEILKFIEERVKL
jgi:Rps23 Pro-64 3,4-dihydroxylase Tpa1-like proline 4-hydroxylase